ncbi:MAG: cell wall hydrolase [Eubacteriales bacterium]
MKVYQRGFLTIVAIFLACMFQSQLVMAQSISILEELQVGAAVILEATIEIKQEEIEEFIEWKIKERQRENAINSLVMANVNEYVNMRSEADQNTDITGVLYKDCGGTLIEQDDEWSLIQSGNVVGWVKNAYLLFGEEAAEEAQKLGRYIAVVDTDALRVRKDTSEESGIYGLVAMGERVDVVEETDEWIGIEYEGNIGYLSAVYLDVEFEVDHAESIESIKERERIEAEKKAALQQSYAAIQANVSDLDLLAALIYCEAGGESYEGKLAVGAVVMNRVRSPGYPNTIFGVIYASGQFTPAMNGKVEQRIALGSPASCYQAAQEALNGVSNVGSFTRFRRAGNIDGYIIGNHVFY